MADILAALFETRFIARCPIISGRSSQYTILRDAVRVSRRSARSVTPVTITLPSMTPASRNFIVIPINRRPFSPVSPLVISSLTLSSLSRGRAMEFESADLGEASYFSHPSSSSDLSTVSPAASSPAFRPPPFLLSPLPRIHSLLISSSLIRRDRIYKRGGRAGRATR